jgi:NADH-quinone oxidoreductase subunit L
MAETFFGSPRSENAAHAHENGPAMTGPLVILAACAVLLSLVNLPSYPWLTAKLLGEHEVHGHPIFEGAGLMGLSIVLVALGIGAGWALYGRTLRAKANSPDPLAQRVPGVFAALANRLGFDELYAATVGRLNTALAALSDLLDHHVWGGAVRFLAGLGQFTGLLSRETDEQTLNGGFDTASGKLRGVGLAYSKAQSGEAHGYLRTLALGFVILLLLVVLGGAR